MVWSVPYRTYHTVWAQWATKVGKRSFVTPEKKEELNGLMIYQSAVWAR